MKYFPVRVLCKLQLFWPQFCKCVCKFLSALRWGELSVCINVNVSRSNVLCVARFSFTKGTSLNSKDDSVSLAILKEKNNPLIKISERKDKYSEGVLCSPSNYRPDSFYLN